MKSQAIVFTAPGEIALQELELPPLGAQDLLVKTHFSLVSSGTELRVLAGHYGAAGHFPLVPGYAFVGEVVEVGSEAEGWRVGDLVSAGSSRDVAGVYRQWGGQMEFHICDGAGGARPVLLPEGADLLDYLVTEIAAIAARGVHFARPQSGEGAVVVGQGLIGAFACAILAVSGAGVAVCDLSPRRLERARSWGAAHCLDAAQPGLAARLQTLFPGGPDIVIESSGSAPGLALARELVARSPWEIQAKAPPRLVLQANYLHEETRNPFEFFEGEALQLFTPSDRRLADRARVVEMIRAGKLPSRAFLDPLVPFSDAPTAYKRLRDQPNDHFSLAFDWRNA